jgi:ketosteroid isomerase-like protein
VGEQGIDQTELDELLGRLAEAETAFISGEMDRYLELTPHAHGFSLANPFGGAPQAYDDRAKSIKAAADFFEGGEARIELIEAHSWDDTLVLVMVLRQHGRVGGLPDQRWDLRVTQVYRREGPQWLLLHRHADPLIEPLGLERAAEIARGTGTAD